MIRQWVRVFVIANSISISLGTLFPFNFSRTEASSIKEIFQGFHHVSNPQDLLANILLFVPFGFSCSWLLWLKGFKGIKLVLAILGISVAFSTTIEVLQIFLSDRFSTKSDIFTNSLGGFLGYLSFFLFYWCLSVSPAKLRRIFKPRNLFLWLITYLTIMICITIPVSKSVSLVNWNTNFPLVLGNEATGDRPWYGSVAQLSIFDRAFSTEEVQKFLTTENIASNSRSSLLGYYKLSGSGGYRDTTGQLPVLAWQGQPSSNPVENLKKQSVLLTPHQWLVTSDVPELMVEKIRQTSQFTLCTVIATTELNQSGPARIISLSKDPNNRNFTLAQEGNSLVFRLRNSLMGSNGDKFKLLIPHVFTNKNYHRLVISYDHAIIKIHLDNLNELFSWKLMPEATFFTQLFSYKFNYKDMFNYKILFYFIIFIPLGFLLALSYLVVNKKSAWKNIFFGVIIASISGTMQALLANGSQTNFDTANFLLSICIAIFTFFLVAAIISVRKSIVLKPA